MDNEFDTVLSNYDAADPNLMYSWSIMPNITSPSNYIFYSKENSVMIVTAGGLAYNTAYNISLTIQNKNYNDTMVTKFINFTTSSPPTGGIVAVSPTTGTAQTTNASVAISNWVSSNQPIMYRVYGVT